MRKHREKPERGITPSDWPQLFHQPCNHTWLVSCRSPIVRLNNRALSIYQQTCHCSQSWRRPCMKSRMTPEVLLVSNYETCNNLVKSCDCTPLYKTLTLSIILTVPKKFSDDTYKAKECILSILWPGTDSATFEQHLDYLPLKYITTYKYHPRIMFTPLFLTFPVHFQLRNLNHTCIAHEFFFFWPPASFVLPLQPRRPKIFPGEEGVWYIRATSFPALIGQWSADPAIQRSTDPTI